MSTQSMESHQGAAAPAEARPAETATPAEGVVINGKRMSQAEFDRWREGFNRDTSKKWEEASQLRKEAEERAAELERREAEIAEREARLGAVQSPRANGDPSSSFDEYIPGLGAFASEVRTSLSEMKTALVQQSAKDQAAAKEQAEAAAFAKELKALESEPYFGDGKELLAFMDENGLGVGQARIGYDALYARREGQVIGEHEALRRGAGNRPPVGTIGLSPGFTSPQQAPGATPRPSDESWDDAVSRALKHPQNPGNR